jgi:Insertion element 4 transposase N-terminal
LVGVSPDGWLPDRVSVGALTKVFPPELVDRAAADAREARRRLLPARLVLYFVLALWLFRGRNCGYGQVLTKLVDGLYHRQRAQLLLDTGRLDPAGWVDAGDGRRWRPPHICNLSRARAKLGPDAVRLLFEEVAGPVGAAEAVGVWCCGLRVISMDGCTSDVPDTAANRTVFCGPSNDQGDGAFAQVRWVVAAESGTGALIEATFGPYTRGEQSMVADLLGAFTTDMLVLADRRWLSPDDCARLFDACLSVPAPGFRVVWGMSANTRGQFSLAEARRLGYQPCDDSETLAAKLIA